jgi:hypothetical protein
MSSLRRDLVRSLASESGGRPDLTLVTGGNTADVRSPEDMLGFLFAREHQLQRELAEVRRQLAIHRERFAAKHDLMALPRVELLRTRFGPQPETEA